MILKKDFKNRQGVTGNHWEVTKITNHLLAGKLEIEMNLYVNTAERTAGASPLNESRTFWMDNDDVSTASIMSRIKLDEADDSFFKDAR